MNKGFIIKCDTSIFDDNEIEYLKRNGQFMEQLASNKRIPKTTAQKDFLRVVNSELRPNKHYEKLWVKYQLACKGEQRRSQLVESSTSLFSNPNVKVKPPKLNKPKIPREYPQKSSPSREPPRLDKMKFQGKPRPKKTGKGDIPEHQRRRVDEGFGGSREAWYKNRRRYDG